MSDVSMEPEQTTEKPDAKMEPIAVPPTSSADDPATRILKRGDLVHVERSEPRLKNRDGGLGRVHRAIPVSDSSDGHPFRYAIDFVLGGRMNNVERKYLVYTTADAEGMTERRKRNPSTVVKEATEAAGVKPAPKKKTGTKTTRNKTAKKGKTAAGAKHKGKKGKAATKKTAAKVKEVPKEKKGAVVRDMYEAHKRDFEKCLGRLEKQDIYAFFVGDPPPESDEDYGTASDAHVSSAQSQENGVSTPAKPAAKPVFPDTPPFNFTVIRKRMAHGRYVLDRVRQHKERVFSSSHVAPELIHPKGVHWDHFRDDVVRMCDAAIARDPQGMNGGTGTLGNAAKKIKDNVLKMYEQNGRRQMKEMENDEARHKFYNTIQSAANNEAAMQGKWRRTAFPERIYERLSSDVICAGLSSLDERTAVYELQTSLPDSFVGLSYMYTDTGQSEGWMKSVLDHTMGSDNAAQERKAALDLAHDDGVVRAQVQATMTSLLIRVQDRVMTEADVLKDNELKSANWAGDVDCVDGAESESDSPDIVEQPVWGIDCYTRRNITSCIEKDFDSTIALEFIEKWLLPAINACPVALAHNMTNAARILEGLSLPCSTDLEQEHADDSGDDRWSHSLLGKALKEKMKKSGPVWLKSVAHQLRLAISTLGHDFFRVHPKGHGAIVLQPKLKANTLVTFYRGEVYPSWRWGEKMDAIELTQTRLGLRPNLPDFYNMALERPQVDPRGYGLLFVDASRKAGHGSSLSHSCEPTCEVRVAAVDGQLCLAMTTIRELELGEEVTFDYNAVTESLNEYRSAVCLCGHGRCRGSFLHFATADCYQEVLNRNLPIAARFSNIIKGCTKQVMSEADEGLLSSHGFGTAAFGAVSFKRFLSDSDASHRALDSMDNVPIWLRTYVADTIRYIEYERRALPVMLLCNHLKRTEGEGCSKNPLKHGRDGGKDAKPAKKRKRPPKDKDESRPIAGSKPEPVFIFFARKQSDFFRTQLHLHGLADLKGIELQRATMKVASSCWAALSDEMKQHWKEQSVLEWEKNGGQTKARLEAERLKSMKAKSKKREPTVGSTDGADTARKKKKSTLDKEANVIVYPSNLSFEAADAEGMSAMEQRIQQLTQTLSRVGRVLDRHRESGMRTASLNGGLPDSAESIHPPLVSLSDDDVVYWLWWHDNGPVRSLLRACSTEKCVSPSLLDALKETERKYSALLKPDEQTASTASQTSRTIVIEALLELRQQLCNGLLMVEGEMKQHELVRSRYKAKKRRDALKKKEQDMSLHLKDDTNVRETVSSILDWMVDSVVEQAGTAQAPNEEETVREASKPVAKDASLEDTFEASPWLEYYADRWKLEASADLLLFYAHTNTFFAIKPYTPLESTPIEVYARELGNAVPRSVMEIAHEEDCSRASNDDVVLAGTKGANNDENVADIALAGAQKDAFQVRKVEETSETVGGVISEQRKSSKSKSRAVCKPDDIITNVTITYHGDFVLSQLLQWYNGGIGQKPGLPNLTGCVSLPHMSDPWHGGVSGKSGKKQPTRYASEVRPILLDWLTDQRKRGSAFEGQLSQAFPGHDLGQAWNDPKFPSAPIGSPVLDLLVTGDDSSIRSIAIALSETIRSVGAANDAPENRTTGSTTEKLESTVDEGMPAQAVSHWVQCEHPNCLKWRKLPWHVDVDALPETFYCSDNKWNPAASTCDAPEDKWDENDSQLKNEGIAKESDAGMVASESNEADTSFARDKASSNSTIGVKHFVIGARFDVLRTGKDYFSTGEVVNVDFSSSVKRVLFHFPKTKAVHDEWIEIDSPRIAPLHTKQSAEKGMRRAKKSGKKASSTVGKNGVAPQDTGDKPKPLDNVEQNSAESRELSKNVPSQAPLLQALSRPATSGALGLDSQVKSYPLVAGSRPAYVTNTTVHSDGRLSMHLANSHQHLPVRPLVAQRRQTSPVQTSRENASRHIEKNDSTSETVASAPSATYTIPRKATVQGGANSLVERIPRKIVSSESVALTDGASLLLGMTASAVSRSAFASNYFPPNLPDQFYQARAMQGQRPLPLPNQYFDARNYWQGQHRLPRQSDGSQSKKQHDDRR